MRRHKATSVSVAAITALAVGITTMAFVYEGVQTADVELNDGGVWVTKPTGLLLGHLNHPAQVIDGGLRTSSTDFDVLQDGETVLLLDQAGATLTPVNPMTVSLEAPVVLPPQSSVSLGGPMVTLVDRDTGFLYATAASQIGSFVLDPEKPLAELGGGAAATPDVDGNVHALSASGGELLTYRLDEDGALPEEPETASFPEVEEGASLTLTTVGDQAVVFDSTTGTVYLPGGREATFDDAKGGVVQAPGAASGDVLIATGAALIRQPLDGGAATVLPAGEPGTPAAPVFLNGCAYAAWSGSGSYLRDCTGDADDVESTIDGLAANAQLRFRVNRDVVVLNDLSTGVVYLVNQDMKKVENWDDIAPPPEQSDSEDEDDSTEEELQVILPDRTEENTPPEAVDDDYGVRAGRTVILPVLDNDIDPDGDVLTATLDGGQPTIGEVQSILNGAAMQVIVAPDASGTASFSYTADDGRGGTDTARVSLTVRSDNQNDAPKQKTVADVLTEVGATTTHNVIPDFSDPDGDDLYVKSASTGGGDQLQFRPDGMITFTSLSTDTGPKDVTVVVSDGRADTEGTVRFVVRDHGSLAPITNLDLVVATVGERITVAPLENDLSPSGAPLRLAKVNPVDGCTIEPDYTTGTFDATCTRAGQFYVQYLVSDGPKTAQGLVRIDVKEAKTTEDPPIAVRDTAQLPTGGKTLVNVLANDTDPNGGILAVQSVQIPADAAVSVEVLEHEILRITDRGLTDPLTITYTVSNGVASARGEVFVTPIPAPDRLLPPVAENDSVTVRAGDVVTIPVLANDHHPNGDTITLSPTLIETPDPADGDIFVAQDMVRFKAGSEAKTVYATYEAVDSQGQKDAGYITIRIVAPDDATNSPPRPQDVTIRALQGTSVRIPIPLNGIDPDGDSVQLVGQDSSPSKGRITEVGEAWLVYEAYPDSIGTDSFTYRVKDKLGASATASILVGIIPASESNQAPYAVKDVVSARPGRTLAVDVMANDTDPDGDPIAIRDSGLEVPDGVQAAVEDGRVVVTAPQTPGDYSILYTIVDRWDATSVGTLQLTVDPDAPLASPIARDDIVPVADAVDRTFSDIDVRENDDDPDGTIDGLTVSVAPAETTATATGDGLLRVQLLPTPQIVTYTVTDQDGLTASAFVTVPGIDGLPPVLKPGIEPIVVNDGDTVDIELDDYVLVAEGKTARITEAAKVVSSHSNGDALVVDENTMRYTPKPHYDGPDALSFEVTDGTGPDDPAGKKATLVIPITVISDYNTPPSFVGASVDVAAGDAEGTVDLKAKTVDPDEGDLDRMSFTLVGQPAQGISARIDGTSLVVTAAPDAPRNTSTLDIDVSDGANPPVRGTVTVNVLATTRNPPSATDDVVPQLNQGSTASVPVLANDYNPFPDKPLTITSATIETGNGSANVNGGSVDVTPAADFVGTMVVRYTVQDATGEADRTADARIRVTVQGRPDAPSTPSVTSIQDRTVVLSWTPPVNNGAEITAYTVTSPQGYSKTCASTTCTLDGLTNDVEYTFTVTATNSVGVSDPSPSSAPARPDARPDQPAPPALVFGDESLAVSWVTPPTHGSAVISYNLEISPAPERGAASRYNVTGNSLVWEGLANGTAYQVRVQAVNKAPEPSDFSAWSAAEIPARAPDAPAAPTTTPASPVGQQAQITVTWAAPPANGDPIAYYTLKTLRGNTEVNSQQVTGTSANAVVAVDTTDYRFQVSAHNKAGDGAFSDASAGRRAAVPPSAPVNVQAGPTGASGQISVSFQPGAGNGSTAGELSYQYRVNQTGATGTLPSGGGNIGGLGNGTDYTVNVWAVSTVEGVQPGAEATSNAANPFAPLQQPSVSADRNAKSVTLSWSPPPGNGRAMTFDVYIDGTLASHDASGSVTRGDAYDETHSIRVDVRDAQGQTSTNNTSQSSGPAPKPKVYLSAGGSCNNTPTDCHYLVVTVEDFPPGGATCTWGATHTANVSTPNGSVTPGWWSQLTPGNPQYSLEGQAKTLFCNGVQAVPR